VKPAQVRELFERFKALNPKPVTELEHSTPFELLVAVILSAQATDKGVNLATRKLFPVANTPQALLALGTDGLTNYVKTIGLYPGKVKNILATCQILLERHGGDVPRDFAALEALPGVGRKTANVVLNSAFGQPTMPVDTHIFRVANRLGLARGKTPREVEDRLLERVPPEYLLHAHHWLLLHGRYICKARMPECPRCPVVDLCEYDAKTLPRPDTLPLAPPPVSRPKIKKTAKLKATKKATVVAKIKQALKRPRKASRIRR
jgi:endonuclease-3